MSNTRVAGNTGILQDVKSFGEKNTTHRSLTESITVSPSLFSTSHGDSYIVNTGDITLAAAKSAVLYLKNDGKIDLIIHEIITNLGNSTGGLATENIDIEIIKNPSTGTIITTATVASVIENRNFGEANNLESTVYKGVSTDTFTDGDVFLPVKLGSSGQSFSIPTDHILIPQGKSIGVNITPQATNSSMIVSVTLELHKSDIPV